MDEDLIPAPLTDPHEGETRIQTPQGCGWTRDSVEVTLDDGRVVGLVSSVQAPSLADYKRVIDEYIEGVALAQEYDDATSFRSRAGYENAFQTAAIAFGQWSDAIYVWSSQQRENPPSTPPSLDEFRALLVSEFPIPDLAVMAPKKTGVLAWFKSWFS